MCDRSYQNFLFWDTFPDLYGLDLQHADWFMHYSPLVFTLSKKLDYTLYKHKEELELIPEFNILV